MAKDERRWPKNLHEGRQKHYRSSSLVVWLGSTVSGVLLSMMGMSREMLGRDLASEGCPPPPPPPPEAAAEAVGGGTSIGSELWARRLRNRAVLFSAVAWRGMIGMGRGVGLGERSQRAAKASAAVLESRPPPPELRPEPKSEEVKDCATNGNFLRLQKKITTQFIHIQPDILFFISKAAIC